jgi:hypothetical protein
MNDIMTLNNRITALKSSISAPSSGVGDSNYIARFMELQTAESNLHTLMNRILNNHESSLNEYLSKIDALNNLEAGLNELRTFYGLGLNSSIDDIKSAARASSRPKEGILIMWDARSNAFKQLIVGGDDPKKLMLAPMSHNSGSTPSCPSENTGGCEWILDSGNLSMKGTYYHNPNTCIIESISGGQMYSDLDGVSGGPLVIQGCTRGVPLTGTSINFRLDEYNRITYIQKDYGNRVRYVGKAGNLYGDRIFGRSGTMCTPGNTQCMFYFITKGTLGQ